MSSQNDDSGMGPAILGLILFVFSPLFPILLLSLCAISWLLASSLHLPQFGLWAELALLVLKYAGANSWAAIALLGFGAFALFLAWVAFREHAARASGAIGGWVRSLVVAAILYWMVQAWPFDGSGVQFIAFGLVLLVGWSSVCEASLDTIKLVAIHRPQPGAEVVMAQKAHGDARVAGEDEALSLLNSRR